MEFRPAAGAFIKSDGTLLKVVGAFNASDVVPATRNSQCSPSGGLHPSGGLQTEAKLSRWRQQWSKVQSTYAMLRRYELESGSSFDYVVRLRLDVIFMKRMPSVASLDLAADEVMSPLGVNIYAKPGSMNDHMVVCRHGRQACDSYFNVYAMYQSCQGVQDFGADGGEQLLTRTMQSRGIRVRQVDWGYTLFNGCDKPVAVLGRFGPSGRAQCFRLPNETELCNDTAARVCSRGRRRQ